MPRGRDLEVDDDSTAEPGVARETLVVALADIPDVCPYVVTDYVPLRPGGAIATGPGRGIRVAGDEVPRLRGLAALSPLDAYSGHRDHADRAS
jgi:hypothetical protein